MAAAARSAHSASMRDQLLRESLEMIRFAFASGKSVPTSVVDAIEQYQSQPEGAPPLDASALVAAHARLAKIVVPATPRAIVLLVDEDAKDRRFGFLGPVPLVRRMMGVALTCVALFILFSLSKMVDGSDIDILHGAGVTLLVNELFWLSAAGIGASFAMLFQMNEYIVKCNYDPKYEPSYWIKFMLGVMAGFILVTLVPLPETAAAAGAAGGAEGAGGAAGAGLHLAKPTIAMLGGYSASAVYRILTRLVEAVESLFRGNTKELIAEREQAAAARTSEEASRARVRLAARLVDLQQTVATGAAGDEVAQRIREIVASLTPEAGESDAIPAPQPAQQGNAPASPVTVDAPPEAIVAAARRAPAEEEAAAAG